MNWDLVSTILGGGALFVGCLMAVIGGIGIVRLPDFYSRMHGAGITDTMGAGLVLVGLMFFAPSWLVVVKLAMIWFFLWVTSPTSGHALARAALEHGIKPWTPGGSEATRWTRP